MVEPKNEGMKHPAFQAQVWQPGQSGNPDGRPKGPSFEERVLGILEETIGDTGKTKAEFLARVFVDEMLAKRNARLIVEFIKRVWPELTRHEVNGSLTLAQWIQRAREEPDEDEETPE